MKDPKEVEVLKSGEDRVTLVFPKGTRVALKSKIPLDALLKVMADEPEVEGQERPALCPNEATAPITR